MKVISWLAGAALALASALATASDWQDVKDPKALHALYSNKTFKGKDYLDRPFVGHYRPDGRGVMLFEGAKYPRTWKVVGEDQVCVDTQMQRLCYRFQRHTTKPGVYRSINVANDMATVIAVEDGIPSF